MIFASSEGHVVLKRGRAKVRGDARLGALLHANCSGRWPTLVEAEVAAADVPGLCTLAQVDPAVESCVGAWLHGHCDVDRWAGEIERAR